MSTKSQSPYPLPSSKSATVRMKANRSVNTSPELKVRSKLHKLGYRYRVHLRVRVDEKRPISIDIAFPSRMIAVFVDGCFWHGCKEHRSIPVENGWYWSEKIAGNASRDRITVSRLCLAGWKVIRVWEHEPVEDAVERIVKLLGAA